MNSLADVNYTASDDLTTVDSKFGTPVVFSFDIQIDLSFNVAFTAFKTSTYRSNLPVCGSPLGLED